MRTGGEGGDATGDPLRRAAGGYVRVIGLQVDDAESYRRYREGMTPILRRYGGRFGYDFEVAKVLANQGGKKINRVFTIGFADRESSKRFFADAEYLAVRTQWFEPAVSAVTVMVE